MQAFTSLPLPLHDYICSRNDFEWSRSLEKVGMGRGDAYMEGGLVWEPSGVEAASARQRTPYCKWISKLVVGRLVSW